MSDVMPDSVKEQTKWYQENLVTCSYDYKADPVDFIKNISCEDHEKHIPLPLSVLTCLLKTFWEVPVVSKRYSWIVIKN